MNAGLGFLIELLGFSAAAYVVIAMRTRHPQFVTDAILAAIGAAMGAGALLFQDDVGLVGGVLAPPLAALLLVAHVRGLSAMGVQLPDRVELPRWLDIPPLRGGRAYASAPTITTREEPVQQPQSTADPDPELEPELEPMRPQRWRSRRGRRRSWGDAPRRGSRAAVRAARGWRSVDSARSRS